MFFLVLCHRKVIPGCVCSTAKYLALSFLQPSGNRQEQEYLQYEDVLDYKYCFSGHFVFFKQDERYLSVSQNPRANFRHHNIIKSPPHRPNLAGRQSRLHCIHPTTSLHLYLVLWALGFGEAHCIAAWMRLSTLSLSLSLSLTAYSTYSTFWCHLICILSFQNHNHRKFRNLQIQARKMVRLPWQPWCKS